MSMMVRRTLSGLVLIVPLTATACQVVAGLEDKAPGDNAGDAGDAGDGGSAAGDEDAHLGGDSSAAASGTDAGDDACKSLPGASAFSGTCLTDANAAPDVQTVESSDEAPAAAGGVIEQGTYFLTTRTVYKGGGGYPGIMREVLRVSGMQMFIVYQQEGGDPTNYSRWGMINVSGGFLSPDPGSESGGYQCPPVVCGNSDSAGSFGASPSYTATTNELLVIYPRTSGSASASNVVLTYERQP